MTGKRSLGHLQSRKEELQRQRETSARRQRVMQRSEGRHGGREREKESEKERHAHQAADASCHILKD